MSQRRAYDEIRGDVRGEDGRPVAHLSVFLDRGDAIIERYETDSLGVFQFPLWANTPHRATWLMCARGAIPFVGKPERDEFARPRSAFHRYQLTASPDSVWGFYRSSGWSGPLPRECPPARDVVGWRYPASAGKSWGSYTTEEPNWARYPGPPALPTR